MHNTILTFWFEETPSEKWWKKDEAFDALIKKRFGDLHEQACCGELFEWRKEAKGALAEIIILDQFSRNIYRDQALAFVNDSLALSLAQFAIEKGLEQSLSNTEKHFLYLPFMHSESIKIHNIAIELFTALGNENLLGFELKHKKIIEQFGRYPHRNQVLGRKSTAEELEFLRGPNSSF
ncbi:MAG: DUF924 family protein [Pseudomonadota bacterium]